MWFFIGGLSRAGDSFSWHLASVHDMLKLDLISHGERRSTAFSYGSWELQSETNFGSESCEVIFSTRWVARSPVQEDHETSTSDNTYSHPADTHALNPEKYRDTPLPMTAPFFHLALVRGTTSHNQPWDQQLSTKTTPRTQIRNRKRHSHSTRVSWREPRMIHKR